jgi:valyl-tRNA synthetase
VFSVSSSAAVFLFVKGRVDIDGEISKADKKLKKTQANLEKQRKMMESSKGKVSEALQEEYSKKLGDLEIEEKGFKETIDQFEKLKIE